MFHRRRLRAVCLAWSAWILLYGSLKTAALGSRFAYHLNVEVLWRIFGVPENNYGFQNLVLPEIVTQFVVATPCVLVGIYVYDRCTSPNWSWSRRWTVLAALLGFVIPVIAWGFYARGIDQTKPLNPTVAWVFFCLAMLISCVTLWRLIRVSESNHCSPG